MLGVLPRPFPFEQDSAETTPTKPVSGEARAHRASISPVESIGLVDVRALEVRVSPTCARTILVHSHESVCSDSKPMMKGEAVHKFTLLFDGASSDVC